MATKKQELTEQHAEHLRALLEQNTKLTAETQAMTSRIDELIGELHKTVCKPS